MVNENIRPGEGGTGSAEQQTGKEREEQKARHLNISTDQRQDIADQTGLKPEDIQDVQETGAVSGRDDAAGGSGDDMNTTSTNDDTKQF